MTPRRLVQRFAGHYRAYLEGAKLRRLRGRARSQQRPMPGRTTVADFDVEYIDLRTFYVEYKDIFLQRIYHFDAARPDPLIIDGGGNIGMSVLYFKHAYPRSRVICFEPDAAVFDVLRRNVTANRLMDVELVQAGLAREAGTATFQPDGDVGGKITAGQGAGTITTTHLSGYLTSEVDFLKLNIEGQELPVLEEAEASGKLRNVRELVLEYHGWPGERQLLGPILDLLDRQGFRYLIHDFDSETCGATKPPFRWLPETTWWCLVYARRI